MMIEITYDPAWRAPIWDDDIPPRPAFFLHCQEHGQLADGWGFAEGWRAQGSATRHRNRYHRSEHVTITNWYGLLLKAQRAPDA
jgi:hypothetical protein